jgi:hypothetical protein
MSTSWAAANKDHDPPTTCSRISLGKVKEGRPRKRAPFLLITDRQIPQSVIMRIIDKTDTSLTLFDVQADKRFGIKAAAVFLGGVGLFMTWEGFWEILIVFVPLIVGLIVYGRLSAMQSEITFDRSADLVTLKVTDRRGTEDWTWALSDVETVEISTVGRTGTDRGRARPNLVLRDGTRVPMRPYLAAGGQSWNAVAAVKLFLGQPLEDAPVGWISPAEFDTYFSDEMARLYRKG